MSEPTLLAVGVRVEAWAQCEDPDMSMNAFVGSLVDMGYLIVEVDDAQRRVKVLDEVAR